MVTHEGEVLAVRAVGVPLGFWPCEGDGLRDRVFCGALRSRPWAASLYAVLFGLHLRLHSEELPQTSALVGIGAQGGAVDMEFVALVFRRL